MEKKLKTVDKVWGEEMWVVNDVYCGKLLRLKKSKRCSLHFHKIKDETFFLYSGKVVLEINGIEYNMLSGYSQRIMPKQLHRFSALEDSLIIEFSTHHEDSDTYRVNGQLSGDIPIETLNKLLEKNGKK